MTSANTHIHKSYVLIAMLLELVPTRQLFAGTQINLETLSQTDGVPLVDCIQLVHNILEHSERTDVAVMYGRHLGMVSHGPVGYATLSAPTLGQALETFVQWFRIRCDIYHYEIRYRADDVEIVLYDTTGDRTFAQFFFMTYMRTNEILIQQISGSRLNAGIELHFTQSDGRSPSDQEAFDAELYFDCPENKLRLPRALWERESPLYDQAMFAANLQKCEQLWASQQTKTQLHIQVQQLIKQSLESNLVHSPAAVALPSLEQICDQLHVSRRSLIRKLKQQGTSYQEIVQQERQHKANLLLKQARYSVYEIAYLLGYGESANFCRAFKSWTGKSPNEFRRNAS